MIFSWPMQGLYEYAVGCYRPNWWLRKFDTLFTSLKHFVQKLNFVCIVLFKKFSINFFKNVKTSADDNHMEWVTIIMGCILQLLFKNDDEIQFVHQFWNILWRKILLHTTQQRRGRQSYLHKIPSMCRLCHRLGSCRAGGTYDHHFSSGVVVQFTIHSIDSLPNAALLKDMKDKRRKHTEMYVSDE